MLDSSSDGCWRDLLVAAILLSAAVDMVFCEGFGKGNGRGGLVLRERGGKGKEVLVDDLLEVST